MPKKIKLLAYIRQYPPPFDGGAFFYNYHLFKELHQLGCQITILSHLESKTQPADGIELIPVKSIKTARFVYRHSILKLVDFVSNVLVLGRYLSSADYDFIFSDAGYMQNLAVFIANFLKGIPVVGLNHGEEINSLQKTTRLRAWLQRRLLESHSINICNSTYTKELISACGVKKPIVVIYPFLEKKSDRNKACDRQIFLDTYNINPDSLIIGFLGRYNPRKGLLNLIEAVERLLIEKKNITLLMNDHGAQADRITNRIERSAYQNQFKTILVPNDESKDRFFNGIDIFAMPNYEDPITGDTEGFGIVFIEAAQYGTPVIGGNAGGVKEAIQHQYNGFLVDGRSVDSIADAIRIYYQNTALRERHSQNGKEWVKKFIEVESFHPLMKALNEKKSHK